MNGSICDSSKALIEIEIETDHYGQETSWKLVLEDEEKTILMQNQTVLESRKVYAHYSCQSKNDCFTFTLTDSYEDGICCNYGNGSYLVLLDGDVVTSGGIFEGSKSTTFGYGCPAEISSSIPSSKPSQKPILSPTFQTNNSNDSSINKIGPVVIENIKMYFYGLKNLLGGANMTILEYRMKSYFEEFYKDNSTGTIQKFVENLETNIVVTRQNLSISPSGKRSLFDIHERKMNENTNQVDGRLMIQYTQTITYSQVSSTRINVESLMMAPFSTSGRRQEFIQYLKTNNDGGGRVFNGLYKVDGPLMNQIEDVNAPPHTNLGQLYFYLIIVGIISGTIVLLFILQSAFCIYWRRHKYGKSKDQPQWPVHVMPVPGSENSNRHIMDGPLTLKSSGRNEHRYILDKRDAQYNLKSDETEEKKLTSSDHTTVITGISDSRVVSTSLCPIEDSNHDDKASSLEEGSIVHTQNSPQRSTGTIGTTNTSFSSGNDSDEPSQSLNRSIDMFDCRSMNDDAMVPPEREKNVVDPEIIVSQSTDLQDDNEGKHFDEIKDHIEKDIYSDNVPMFEGMSENKIQAQESDSVKSEQRGVAIKCEESEIVRTESEDPSIFSSSSTFSKLYNESNNDILLEKILNGYLASNNDNVRQKNHSNNSTRSELNELISDNDDKVENDIKVSCQNDVHLHQQDEKPSNKEESNDVRTIPNNTSFTADHDYSEIKEEEVIIYAPPGKLGMILDRSEKLEPIVHTVKEKSCLSEDLQKGDKLVSIDGVDVRSFTPLEISKLLAKTSTNALRIIIVKRMVYNRNLVSI